MKAMTKNMTEQKKYEFTGKVRKFTNGISVRRVRALIDIPRYGIKAGDIGGFLESESNLSHDGESWVGGNAIVCGDVKVCGNAWVGDNARVWGDAEISGNACVFHGARLGFNTKISGDSEVGC
jgi:carbonic anhydrase/acetyltransferase-like protein (isoleucine patch superfamily)